MTKPSRATVAAFRKHLNKLHGLSVVKNGAAKTGARKREYGDYLYAQDREMFFFDMREAIADGSFTAPAPK